MANPHDRSDSIFLHSLWRSGSTYFFNVFRRNPARYFAFQEPVHEIMLEGAKNPEVLMEMQPAATEWMRHPKLDEAYFREAYITQPSWKHSIRKELIYDSYFGGANDDLFVDYIRSLQSGREKTVVIQECRTSNRIGLLRDRLGGRHFYLSRDPWNQWWSYKISSYFVAATQAICNADNRPASLDHWAQEHGFNGVRFSDIREEFAYYERHPLSAGASYQCFFILWVLGWVHARQHADLMVDMDALSTSGAYRDEILGDFARFGVEGIKLDDCALFRAPFMASDERFFRANEEAAWHFLAHDNLDPDIVAEIRERREQSSTGLRKKSRPLFASLTASLVRAREAVVRLENEGARAASELTRLAAEREHDLHQKSLHGMESIRRSHDEEIDRFKSESENALNALAAQFEAERQNLIHVQQETEEARHQLALQMEQQSQHHAESIEHERQKLSAAQAQMEQHRREADNRAEQLKRDAEAETARITTKFEARMVELRRELTHEFYADRQRLIATFDSERSQWGIAESQLSEQLKAGQDALERSRLQLLDQRARAAVDLRAAVTGQNALRRSRKRYLTLRIFDRGEALEWTYEDRQSGDACASGIPHVQAMGVDGIDNADHRWSSSLTLENMLALPTTEFVQTAYKVLFGRAADNEGLDHSTTRLLAGVSRISVLRDLMQSPEARRRLEHEDLMELNGQAFIYGVYERFLHRSPDSTGLNHHLELLGSTGDKRALLLSIANSGEAERAGANERRLVNQIIRLVNRKPKLRERIARLLFPVSRENELNALGERMSVLLSRVSTGAHESRPAQVAQSPQQETVERTRRRRLRSPNEASMVERLMTQIRSEVGTGVEAKKKSEPARTQAKPQYDRIAAEVSRILVQADRPAKGRS